MFPKILTNNIDNYVLSSVNNDIATYLSVDVQGSKSTHTFVLDDLTSGKVQAYTKDTFTYTTWEEYPDDSINNNRGVFTLTFKTEFFDIANPLNIPLPELFIKHNFQKYFHSTEVPAFVCHTANHKQWFEHGKAFLCHTLSSIKTELFK